MHIATKLRMTSVTRLQANIGADSRRSDATAVASSDCLSSLIFAHLQITSAHNSL